MLIDFENIQEKCDKVASTKEYEDLIDKVNKSKKIYLVGNGGLHFVACHMSTDLSRLIPDKTVYSFDSVGFITSNANDHGFEQLFVRWLESVALTEKSEECLIIGLSCSGNSSNVINALHWGEKNGMDTFLISGEKSDILDSKISEISIKCKYFHTVEVAIMMIFYDLIHRTGNRCPSIRQEKERMIDSPLRRTSEQ